MTGDLLDDLFSACALAAYLEQSAREQGWPDPEATRRLAYRLYEDALTAKDRDTQNAPRAGRTVAG